MVFGSVLKGSVLKAAEMEFSIKSSGFMISLL